VQLLSLSKEYQRKNGFDCKQALSEFLSFTSKLGMGLTGFHWKPMSFSPFAFPFSKLA
jgi:hypothetical protein